MTTEVANRQDHTASALLLTSVIIPTWNSTATLTPALASIEDAPDGVEIILVDDCSDDIAALRDISDADPRITLIEKPVRTNAAHSRALGQEHAKGELVLFLDSDDRYLPGHLARRRALHAEHEAGIVIGRFQLNDGARQWLGPMNAYQGGVFEDYLFAGGGDARSSTISIDTSLASGTTFDAALAKHQDWGFVLTASRNGERIGFDPAPGAVISIAGGGRMSGRSNVEASLGFARDYLRSDANRRRFLLGRLRTSLRLGDAKSARLFRDALLELAPSTRERWSSAAMVLAGQVGVAAPLHRLLARR